MSQDQKTTINPTAFTYCRKLRLHHPPVSAEALITLLDQLPGMQKVGLESERQLILVYDTTKLQLQQVLTALDDSGTAVDSGRWQRLRIAWYQFVDRNAQQNAQRTETHCCNKPPTMSGRKR